MKAYNVECLGCGFRGDRIKKGNEVLKCSNCNQPLTTIGGPIGGEGILPLALGQPDRFIAYESQTLGRKINTAIEMQQAFEDMYGIKAIVDPVSSAKIPKEEDKPTEPRKRGRPRKTEINDDDDDKDGDDDDV